MRYQYGSLNFLWINVNVILRIKEGKEGFSPHYQTASLMDLKLCQNLKKKSK